MWQYLGKWVIRYRFILLIILLGLTILMGYFASKVTLSYEFSKAIPTDNPKYKDYQAFKQKFGDDGNLLVIGVETDSLFTVRNFSLYQQLEQSLKQDKNVEDILSIPGAVNFVKDSLAEKLSTQKIFPAKIDNQQNLDSFKAIFYNLPFYNDRLYNINTHSYLMGVRINKDVLNTSGRTVIIENVKKKLDSFALKSKIETHISGLPLIRTELADRIQKEMKLFLVVSVLLSAFILLLFFRSFRTMMLSLAVVLVGVIWTVGILYLCGYKITLLTALVPSLVVVIGIPNCIYFLNKYHSSYIHSGDKYAALVTMVSKMGIVTLFCNIAAAIGFAVFAFTNSAILKEFGVVAGLSIMVIFVISFIMLPSILSYLSEPKKGELKYLESKWITRLLEKLEDWVFMHKKTITAITLIVVLFSIAGMILDNNVIWKLFKFIGLTNG